MNDTRLTIGHATHVDWRVACELALAQLGGEAAPVGRRLAQGRVARSSGSRRHGLVYVSLALAEHFDRIVAMLSAHRPDVLWAGACVPGVLAGQGEYLDEPAIALLAGDLRFEARDLVLGSAFETDRTAGVLILADPRCTALREALAAAYQRLGTEAVFGGVVADAAHLAGDPHPTGGSARAIALSHPAQAWSRATLGTRPIARPRLITSIRNRHLETLDHRPALEVLLEDLGVATTRARFDDPASLVAAIRAAIPAQGMLMGILPAAGTPRRPGVVDQRLCHLIGIEPSARLVAIDETAIPGEQLVLLGLDAAAARTDLIRVCTELRDELEASGQKARLIHYVSCVARGRSLFGSSGVETALIAHNFGELPLIGFFAHGEIGQGRLRGYSAILTAIV